MFGYVTINRPELKVKDLETYQVWYCGLCERLRRRSGLLSGMTLNYDMTFLALLLSSLYEEEEMIEKRHCLGRPVPRNRVVYTKAMDYAADMNLLMAYHNLMDDWLDEKNLKSLTLARILHRAYCQTARRYPRQRKAIVRYVRELRACESRKLEDLEYAAGLTGRMMAEIYIWKEDFWKDTLGTMGYFMGKFIYLMDAYEDVEKDQKTGNYNPLLSIYGDEAFDSRCREYLELTMSSCAKAFELLPILEHGDLLRNILYSGVWMNFQKIQREREKNRTGEK